ncbi:hypothetical protein NDU88_000398 [Pleurodeles waltl]|uniref:Uncharacterized protein n=1 Tax=Pleurodeles waltl TaxID=8319 RepID=A0AAV7S5Z8_PLEWA|nr:hypothetical protein NDU88_000398 [Pleurodeles waltl]
MSWLTAREAESPQHSPPGLPGSSLVLRGCRPSRRLPHSGPDGPTLRRPERVPPPGCSRRSLALGRPQTHVGLALHHLPPLLEVGARDCRIPGASATSHPHQSGAAGPQAPDYGRISRAVRGALLARVRHLQRLGHAP